MAIELEPIPVPVPGWKVAPPKDGAAELPNVGAAPPKAEPPKVVALVPAPKLDTPLVPNAAELLNAPVPPKEGVVVPKAGDADEPVPKAGDALALCPKAGEAVDEPKGAVEAAAEPKACC